MTDHPRTGGLAISPALRDALSRWLDHLSSLNEASPHTIEAYRSDVATFLDFLARHHGGAAGIQQLRDVTTRDMRAWMAASRADGRGARTLARALSALKGFARWLADREDDFEATAILSARAPRHQRALPRPLDEDAARTVTESISDEKAMACIVRRMDELIVDEQVLRDCTVPAIAIVGGKDSLKPFADQFAEAMPPA